MDKPRRDSARILIAALGLGMGATCGAEQPKDWISLNLNDANAIEIDRSVVLSGAHSVRLHNDDPGWKSEKSLYQIVNAAPYLQQTVRVSAQIRTDAVALTSRTRLWIKLTNARGDQLVYRSAATSDDTADWQLLSVEADVPRDATELWYGVRLGGSGTAWVDAVQVDCVACTGAPPVRGADESRLSRPSNLDFDGETY